MKLELIRRSWREDYVCYAVDLTKHGRKNKIFRLYLPRNVVRFPPERFVTFCSVVDADETKHTCRTCGKTYPRYKYAKHARRNHK